MAKVKHSTTYDEEVYEEVERRAKEEGRSASNYINQVLREAFNLD